MDRIQMAILSALVAYFLYYFYYYVAPMCYFRVLLVLAVRRRLCSYIQLGDERITIHFSRDGVERTFVREVVNEDSDRFLCMAACTTLKKMLADIKNGNV